MPRRRERRRNFRVEWNTPARIRLPNSRSSLPCVVHNLSNTGARITSPEIARVPDQFTLELSPEGNRARVCRVVWRTSAELGVKFIASAPRAPRARQARSTGSGDGLTGTCAPL
jgi:hypothetical protein